MFMHRPHAVKGRVSHKGPKSPSARNRRSTPVRMTNQMTVMHKGSRGKKRGGKRR
jgi:hypothetical protein